MESLAYPAHGVIQIVALCGHQQLRRDRQTMASKNHFGNGFVHAQGAAAHTAAHVGQPQQLEKPLHRAVFAGRAVQRREHNLRLQCAQRVDAPGVQFDEVRLVSEGLQGGSDLCGGIAGHFGFRRGAAHEHRDT